MNSAGAEYRDSSERIQDEQILISGHDGRGLATDRPLEIEIVVRVATAGDGLMDLDAWSPLPGA